jgi:hypothetical protein
MNEFEVSATQLQALIRETVQAVLQEKVQRRKAQDSTTPPGVAQPKAKQILVAVCCGECLRPEATAALDELKSAGFVLVEPGPHELKERATRERLVAKSELVVLPSLGDDDAAKMALGIFDEPTARVALSALALGKPLLASPHSPYDDALKARSPVLFNLWQGYRKTLENFGFQIVEAEALAGAAQAHLTPKVESKMASATLGKPAGKRRVITAQEIEAAAQNGKRLDVPSNAVVTPLARDRARELGVKI